jgi:hypothetical protein
MNALILLALMKFHFINLTSLLLRISFISKFRGPGTLETIIVLCQTEPKPHPPTRREMTKECSVII